MSENVSERLDSPAFWEHKKLQDMTHEQWESLCDGCAKCCLVKLVDDETEELHYTSLSCRLLNEASCRCNDYANRSTLVDGCLKLTPETLPDMMSWLPETCSYKLLAEGQALPPWHPLITGDPQSVHDAGISIQGKCTSEKKCDGPEQDYIVPNGFFDPS
ncbi:MAG: YcgN family cysteine cluster protein [Parvibaculales bacterium]